MLQSLRIRNLALLEDVSLEFDTGFTAVTGETGAGKSILIGALSLLAGERADKTIIRQGAAACEVEAALYFADPRPIDKALASLELPACEDGVLLLKRSLSREKPPKITINGSLATLAALQQLGERWIDFHGPSEPRRLLKANCQLELLDLYGRTGEPLAGYQEKYRAWRSLLAERARLTEEKQLSPDQISFFENQLAKLDELELTDEAIETLERDFQRMSRAQELIGLAAQLDAGLRDERGVSARLAALVRDANQLGKLDPASQALADRLSAVAVELAELGVDFAGLSAAYQFDAEHAAQLEANMNAWLDAKRRHGGDVAAVRAARDSLRQRLASQGDFAGACARLDAQAAAAERTARQAAQTLRAARQKAARALARVAAQSIAQLGFARADFKIEIAPLPEPGPSGDCTCEFLFSPNVGEAPLPLNRIASSGELARVMLALKTVLADLDGIPVLIFDEVDANVGGEIGLVVGAKMAAIGRSHQVFCVTHLPQVAAQAANHWVVSKDQSGGRAIVAIKPLHDDRPERLRELARMLGDRSAKSALAHAEELLGR